MTVSSLFGPVFAGAAGALWPIVDGSTEIIPINTIPKAKNPNTTPAIGVKLPVTANSAAAARVTAHIAQNIFAYMFVKLLFVFTLGRPI
jgi:hypothetical protein